MLSKHICGSMFGIDTFYERILRPCEVVKYEQYVRVKIYRMTTASVLSSISIIVNSNFSFTH